MRRLATILLLLSIRAESETYVDHIATAAGLASNAIERTYLHGDFDNDSFEDIFAIHHRNTVSGRLEVHVLSGASGYQQFILHTATASEYRSGNADFALADYNQDGYLDLYIVLKNGTGSGHIEVHVLDGNHSIPGNLFQRYLAHLDTFLPPVSNQARFFLHNYDDDTRADLFMVLKNSTGSRRIEVHVISLAQMKFLANIVTTQHVVPNSYQVQMDDTNGDGFLDLSFITDNNSGSARPEVHTLSGNSGYQAFSLHYSMRDFLSIEELRFFDMDHDGLPDWTKLNDLATGSRQLEIHGARETLARTPANSSVVGHIAIDCRNPGSCATPVSGAANPSQNYAYAPAYVNDKSGKHTFYCSAPETGYDYIRHVNPQGHVRVAVSPNLNHFENVPQEMQFQDLSACDPEIVFMNGYYYMLINSARKIGYVNGNQNNQDIIYLARSTTLEGEFQKLSVNGNWETAPTQPAPIFMAERALGHSDGFKGANWPSAVVVNNRIFAWYHGDTKSLSPRYWLSTAARPEDLRSAPQIPTNLMTGHSIQISYDPFLKRFVALSVGLAHSHNASVLASYSKDGIDWSAPQSLNRIVPFSHNIGVLRNELGHTVQPLQYTIRYGAPLDLNRLENCNFGDYSTCDTFGQWNLMESVIHFSIQ